MNTGIATTILIIGILWIVWIVFAILVTHKNLKNRKEVTDGSNNFQQINTNQGVNNGDDDLFIEKKCYTEPELVELREKLLQMMVITLRAKAVRLGIKNVQKVKKEILVGLIIGAVRENIEENNLNELSMVELQIYAEQLGIEHFDDFKKPNLVRAVQDKLNEINACEVPTETEPEAEKVSN